MLQCAIERFIHKAVAIGLGKAAVITVSNDVKTFCVGVIPCQRNARTITQRLLGAATIILEAVCPNASIQRCAILRTRSDNVDYATNRIRAVHRRTRSTNVFDALHQGDRKLAEIGRPRDARLVKADPIDENQDMAGVRTAYKERRKLPHPAILRSIYAGQATHDIQNRGGLPAVDIGPRHDRSRSQNRFFRLFETVCCHHQRVGAFLRPARKCRDGKRRQQRYFFNHC